MTEYPVPDCLVLKIEGTNKSSGELTNTLYILYDKKEHNYVIRGRPTNVYGPVENYSFICENMYELANFVTFVISKKNLWSYSLYNYNSLPLGSSEITFDYLYDNDYVGNQIAYYENKRYNRVMLENNLRMLRNVFNYYN